MGHFYRRQTRLFPTFKCPSAHRTQRSAVRCPAADAATPRPPSTPHASRRPFPRDGENHGHRLRMDRRDHRIRLCRQEGVEVGIHLPLLGLSQAAPVRPDPGEGHQRSVLIRGKPHRHLLALGSRLVLREAGEGHQATVRPP